MELTTRIPGLALTLIDRLGPAAHKRRGAFTRTIDRPEPCDGRLLRDIGVPWLGALHEPERGYAADLVARYGKLD
jgi:hypothetical protein